jgi:hypothetical protein
MGIKWKPSIHMPKDVCRIWLEVTNVRAERLHDITEEDARAEGIREFTKDDKLCKYGLPDWNWQDMFRTAKQSFMQLWCMINGFESWNENPWVWVIEFKVLSTTGKPMPTTEQKAQVSDTTKSQ